MTVAELKARLNMMPDYGAEVRIGYEEHTLNHIWDVQKPVKEVKYDEDLDTVVLK